VTDADLDAIEAAISLAPGIHEALRAHFPCDRDRLLGREPDT